MMTPRKMIDSVFAEPFRPFAIDMASGRPVSAFLRPDDDSSAIDRWEEVSHMLLESVEAHPASLFVGEAQRVSGGSGPGCQLSF